MKRFITIVLALTMLLSISLPASALTPEVEVQAVNEAAVTVSAELPIYQDESYSYAERALDMVSRMTLAEKASQAAGYSAAAIPRLGIAGYMWWNEALHGYSQEGWFGITSDGASYPSSYSMGASWDPDLYYQEAEQIGSEIRELVDDNKYNLTFFSPTVNLARDPRWGRNDESYGEDPLLVGLMGASYVKGVEGKNFDGTYKYVNENGEGIKQAVTTIKHYAANNSEKNRYTSGADNTTVREMREYYTRPARIVVQEADVSSVMMAYSSVGGVPISYSSYYMDTVLRQVYGFSGYIVSDCDSIATSANRNIHNVNPFTGEKYTVGEAFANAMANGLDLQCNAGETDGLGSYASNYKKMLENPDGTKVQTDKGYFTEQQLEVSVARMMTKRMQLGEFDAVNDYVTEGAAREQAGLAGAYVNGVTGQTQERIDLADELSRATIVLLKNEDETLPITESEINAADTYKVGIIGPIGQSNFRGGYSSMSRNEANLVTIEQAIKTAFNDTETYAQSTIDKLEVNYHYGYSSNPNRSSFTGLRSDQISIDAVEEGLDLAIVTLGQGSGDSREDGDRTDLRLSQAQVDLLTAVKAKNPKKLVLIMETYGPVQMTDEIVDDVDAILWSSFNGFRKGTGFGEAITGKNNPSGRTNATWLKDMIGDIPGFFDYSLFPSNGEGGRTYMYNVEDTIYPFGFGLSYSDVTYAPVAGSDSILGADAKDGLVLGTDADPITKDTVIDVNFQITNTNNLAGKQVAEVYVVSPGAGENNLPLKRLVGFDKVEVGANETTEVTIPLNVTDFGFFNEEKDCYELPTGEWQIWVARSSDLNAETDLVESFTVNNGDIREDPTVISVKPTQVGDSEENGVSERVIFNLSADSSKNIINPGVAVTMANEKLYGTRVINNVPGQDLGVDAQAVTDATNATADGFTVPDSASAVERLETGKGKDELPKVGVDLVLPDSYTVTYASNRPEVVQAGSATVAGEFAEGQLVMKAAGVATITVKVTAPSGESAETEFAVCVTAIPALESLNIGGEAVTEFEPTSKSYTCVVPAGIAASDASVTLKVDGVEGTVVEYSTTDDGTGTIGYAPSADGINPTGFPCSIYVKISGEDVAEQIIEVEYVRQFSSSYFLNGEMDEDWTILNENEAGYDLIKGLGLSVPMQSASFSATAPNIFTRPIAGDWTMVTKLTFPEGFNTSGQQVQILAYQDMSNRIAATFSCGGGFSWGGMFPGWPGMGGGGTPTSTSFSMAPTVGGNSNGSISHTTTIKPADGPQVVYLKIEHEEMGLNIWYSEDGINYGRVQSADGRRRGESSYLPDAVFALYFSGAPEKTAVVEYMDVMTMNGVAIKDDQGVLNDAFAAVAEYAGSIIPEAVEEDINLTIPYDYTVTFVADDCIAADGTVTRPATDKVVNTKVILSHPNAKIDGLSEVTVYDGPITVKGTEAAADYYLSTYEMNLMVGETESFAAIYNPATVMSAQAAVKDPSIAALDGFNVTALKKGETEINVTFYGMPNNVELGTQTLKVYVDCEHDYKNGVCTICGEADPDYVPSLATITVGNAEAKAGDTIVVPVSIENNAGFAGYTFAVSTDDGLTLADVTKGSLAQASDSAILTVNAANGQVNWTDSSSLNGDGEILLLTIDVAEDAADGDYGISIALKDDKAMNFVDADAEPIDVTFVSGVVSVMNVIYGDVNNDGEVTSADSVYLARYLVDLEELSAKQLLAADVNHDDDINAADAVVLAKFLVGLIDSLAPSSANSTPGTKFADAPALDSWAYAGIDYCVSNGLMQGNSKSTFNPQGTLTRAELVTILYRVAGEPKAEYAGTFVDVPADTWYTAAVEWAAANEIVNGVGDNKFAPTNVITREQIATILYRYAGAPAVAGSLAYPDVADVSDFAVDALIWATSEGIITGTSVDDVTYLAPQGLATREQIATIIMRYLGAE